MALSYVSLTSLTGEHFVKKKVQCTSNRCQDAFYKKYILWLGALEEEEEFFVSIFLKLLQEFLVSCLTKINLCQCVAL